MKALRLPEVIAKTGLPKSTIYDAIRAGRFPAPARALARSIWNEEEIDAWLAARFAARDAEAAA